MDGTSPQLPQHNAPPRRVPGIPAILLSLFAIGVPSAAAFVFVNDIGALPHIWGLWHCRATSSQKEVAGEATI